jgi:hypothetical protein
LVVAAVLGAQPAYAESAPPGGGAYIGDDGDPTAVAGDGTSSGGEGGGGGGSDGCVFVLAVEDDFAFIVYGDDDQPAHSATGRWFNQICGGENVAFVPEGGLVDPRQVATQALASVGITGPIIETSPASDRLVVRIPAWLWVDGGWWHTYSATATAGRVSATVTVQPVAVEWSTGDGGRVACDGPGVAWTPGASDDSTDCSHTYTRASSSQAAGTFGLTATVQLEITWTSNTGDGGTLPAISRSSSEAVTVSEVQAVGTP